MRIVVDTNAGHVADDIREIRRRLDYAVAQAPREAAGAAVSAYKRVAPVGNSADDPHAGRLRENVHAEGPEVISDPLSDRGFHYGPVRRFGRGPVVAIRARALAFKWGGRLIFRKRVAAWTPASDWVEKGHPGAQKLAGDRFQRLVRDALK